ncbi:MAG: hypothetical protein PHT12_05755 [Patescibacteria group bacterium]|nr:hypothetical protein [Patescibacteria group bacterium]
MPKLSALFVCLLLVACGSSVPQSAAPENPNSPPVLMRRARAHRLAPPAFIMRVQIALSVERWRLLGPFWSSRSFTMVFVHGGKRPDGQGQVDLFLDDRVPATRCEQERADYVSPDATATAVEIREDGSCAFRWTKATQNRSGAVVVKQLGDRMDPPILVQVTTTGFLKSQGVVGAWADEAIKVITPNPHFRRPVDHSKA